MYEQHYNSLLKFLRQRLPSADIAFDLAQETFARVLAAERNITISNPRAFLFRTAENLCVDYYRKSENRLKDQMIDIDEFDHPAPNEVCPDSQLDRSQKIERLNNVVSGLPVRCREVFILHKYEGHSHAEIADRFGISRNAVEKHIIKAMLYLRKQLSEREVQ